MDHFANGSVTGSGDGAASWPPSTPEARGLRGLCKTAALRVVERRTAIVRAGEPQPPIMLVASGWVSRERQLPDGRRSILDLYLPGDLIGVDHLFLERATADIVALTEVGYHRLDRGELDKRLRQDPELALLLMRRQAEETWEHQRQMARLARPRTQDRVTALLARLCERLTVQADPAPVDGALAPFWVRLTAQDLADHLGLHVVQVRRALRALRAAGIIEIRSESLMVPDAARLA